MATFIDNLLIHKLSSNLEEATFIIPEHIKDSSYVIKLSIGTSNSSSTHAFFSENVVLTNDSAIVKIPVIPVVTINDYYIEKNNRITDGRNGILQSKILTVSYYQGHQPYGDITFSFSELGGFHGYPLVLFGPAIGTEFNFEWNSDFILGPKVGGYFSTAIFNFGLFAVAYTDFDKASWYLKPRIGLNPLTPFVNISYEYAIRLSPNHFGTRINVHQLSINLNIPLHLDLNRYNHNPQYYQGTLPDD
ncbi:MAG: hypothetical protein QNK23_01395 [Crocinitomicaceae bacterium]|nr:hypothetical protein [Crocinitomicaceae bacterium]